MKFDSRQGDRGLVIDRDTGRQLDDVIAGDTDTGWYEEYVRGSDGCIDVDYATRTARTRRRRGRILFIRVVGNDAADVTSDTNGESAQ